jgi:dTDP-glucose 4,6-dehydratase
MKILVTGGAGFIGSNYVRFLLESRPEDSIVVLDKLTYAGNMDNLADVMKKITFIKGDIADKDAVDAAAKGCDAIVNFAAETHVDRSIVGADEFIRTDVLGVFVLLEAARRLGIKRFMQISTDEVYGSVENGSSIEFDKLSPNSPYSASKASADLLTLSYFTTYGLPVVITRSSNNFGPYQHPEKLIPKFITNAISGKKLPLYGDGKNVRDWLYVLDNCSGIDLVLRKGKDGEVYNIGGGNERTNLEITDVILNELTKPKSLIEFVKDRPGHDRRYSINCDKVRRLGWKPSGEFEQSLRKTVGWYASNEAWWKRLAGGKIDFHGSFNYVTHRKQGK